MLTTQSPVDLGGLSGVVVYGDTTSDRLYYYMPTRPRIAKRDGVYQYSLIRYGLPLRDDRAGLLSMVVDLHLDEDELIEVKRRLGGGAIDLEPIPWTGGSFAVSLEGGEPVYGVPSLFGTNAATVHFELSTDNLVIFDAALRQGRSPVSMVYKLSFDSYRPAYQCKVELDESSYLDWVRSECRVGLVFVDFQSTKTFETLREKNVLKISCIDFEPAGDSDFKLRILRGLQDLFQPVPHYTMPSSAEKGGWSIGISCEEMRLVQSVSRRVNADMSVAMAVSQATYVQGVVDDLVGAHRSTPPLTVPSDTSFSQTTRVSCYANYQLDEINSVVLDVRDGVSMPLKDKYHVFRPGGDEQQAYKLELDYLPTRDAAYECRFTVHFSDTKSPLESDWKPLGRAQAFASIIARDLFDHRTVEISTSKGFPWHAIARANVALTPPGQAEPVTRLALPSTGKTTYSMFLSADERTDMIRYEVEITPSPEYGSQPLRMGPYSTMADVYIDLFRERTVTFDATKLDWSTVASVAIQVLLMPNDHPLLGAAQSVLNLTEAAPTSTRTYYYTHSSQLTVRYSYLINYSDGHSGPKTGPTDSANPTINITS
jgi:hypothetical protein